MTSVWVVDVDDVDDDDVDDNDVDDVWMIIDVQI